MPNRATLLAAVIVCAIAIPYLSDSEGPGLSPVRQWWGSFFTTAPDDNTYPSEPWGANVRSEAPSDFVTGAPSANLPASRPSSNSRPVSHSPLPPYERTVHGPEFQSLSQILRFDVSPEWVTTTWPLVSTSVRAGDLAGMRLPLVSGTRLVDVAGSLTYWFNPQRQCERIDLAGSTGDTSELVGLLTQGYGLRGEPSPGGMLFVGRDTSGKPGSVLRIRPSQLLRQDQPHRRYAIELELQRPGSTVGISRALRERLHIDGIHVSGLELDSKQMPAGSEQSVTKEEPIGAGLKQGNTGEAPQDASAPPLEAPATPAPSGPRRRRPDTEFLLPHSR